ncbi:YveK family protein [Ligilactobacillus salivarius]|uniref:YveK family protein n=1 Tax=Ligilactobacillus salivarius TaxID=1624 RepID=UPI0022E60146|nr:Wzz/FepE/Etk N-terminal domain-containing protein [Ligilactobacillus salivarius]
MDNIKKEYRELDLFEIFQMLLRHWWIILMSGLLCGLAAFAYSKFAVVPQYTSVTKIYLSNKLTENQTNPTPSTELIKDYEEMVKSRAVLENIIEKYDLCYSYGELSKKVNAENKDETQIISISVTDPNPVVAQRLANSIRDESIKHVTKVMKVISVGVVDKANYPQSQSYPITIKWIEYGFLIGFVLSIGVLLIRFILDDTIKTSEDVEKYLGLSTLAVIPKISDSNNKKKYYGNYGKGKSKRRKRV